MTTTFELNGQKHEFPNVYQATCWLLSQLNGHQLQMLRQQAAVELARRNIKTLPANDDYLEEESEGATP